MVGGLSAVVASDIVQRLTAQQPLAPVAVAAVGARAAGGSMASAPTFVMTKVCKATPDSNDRIANATTIPTSLHL